MQSDYYNILGISRFADLEEIKQAAQIKRNEIRTALGFTVLSQADAQARMDDIKEACETLSKPETRAASEWRVYH